MSAAILGRLRETLARYALPLASASLLALTFHPWNWTPLIWIALAPFVLWLDAPERSETTVFRGAMLLGTLYHYSLLAPFASVGWWGWGDTTLGTLAQYFAYQRVFMAVLIGAVSTWGGLVFGLLAQRVFRPSLRQRSLAIWVIPSAWVLVLEALGHQTVFGFSWGLIGNRVAGMATIRQLAGLTGVLGLSFLVVLVNTVLGAWLASHRRAMPGPRWSTGIAVCLFVGALAYGRHAAAAIGERDGRAIRVAALQGAIAQATPDEFDAQGLDQLYAPMIQAAAAEGAELIVLPETVWLRSLELDGVPTVREGIGVGALHRAIRAATGGRDAVVALGIDASEGGRFYNTTTYWTADGLAGVYRKERLVPFAEYRPALLGRFAPQNRIHASTFVLTPGQGPQVVETPVGPVGSFICQEVLFPALLRRRAHAGAELLVTTGNDAVFTSPAVAQEQLRLAQLRAVETDRWIVRAMKTGVSALIDPSGRLVASAPVGATRTLTGTAHLRAGRSAYARFGEWVAWVCAAVVAAAFFTPFFTCRIMK